MIIGKKSGDLEGALNKLENKGIALHPAQKDAFRKLYAYTSDAHGIRHSLLGKSDLDIEDATFMFIACSAFVNYLLVKADKANIVLLDE